jgi:hypothetical protein
MPTFLLILFIYFFPVFDAQALETQKPHPEYLDEVSLSVSPLKMDSDSFSSEESLDFDLACQLLLQLAKLPFSRRGRSKRKKIWLIGKH